MFYVYVLQSLKNSKRYIGSTNFRPEIRLEQHNKGANRWTRQNRPFELLYSEQCADKRFALKRERFLKSGHGISFLNRILNAK
ncbi:MAG: hypothetical protein A3G33_02545 [Omnitrophica bacterium RIFCSPLOWO2_12_FULL_44_17]|uniref:GIY-YIG domain-containing protein n=1 Tax=Candidatus Danuiimicrobium aquiferis TaxID=1801832 RepID=A0A1G1KW35_9BACT|nr:MAG: hypothetical protein A3B72_00430 [Omnitrophica bacterium RIFCSPHIGHO2_02_FULL_45_28]OGW88326.1 MAG: hypothetical protein A3E74_02405 [Omnitrophica bacterium RIFCSPHIGHO2_12_FULL_44_12]OGW97143.1 MAG: hypothetical protein A3G33_02545 [Omnitrophica bacterium RIFCSPLOWO2_12_FULL_44_17]OGX03867.1 MAG: hypothetical protein A3J12_02265 [Omnitrophica bacterium RIFCSPLOWO2_02_FULL_44_11]